MDLHDGTPFWPRRDGILAVYPPLTTDVSCDVAVVGDYRHAAVRDRRAAVDLSDSIGRDAAATAYLECCRGIDLVEQASALAAQYLADSIVNGDVSDAARLFGLERRVVRPGA